MAGCSNSLLFPPYLLPEGLRDVPKIGIIIGKCLQGLPEQEKEEVLVDLPPRGKGRPRKGMERPVRLQVRKFGGQECRRSDEQVRLLQADLGVACIHRAPLVALVKECLTHHGDYKISRAALDILHEAVEAGIFCS